MDYTVDYFIKKFEAIHEELWCVGVFSRGEQKCANGHCGKLSGSNNSDDEAIALANIFSVLKLNLGEFGSSYGDDNGLFKYTANINDGIALDYQQPTPKQRILAALYDIKAKQQPSYPDITKTLAVLPVEEISDIKTLTPCEQTK